MWKNQDNHQIGIECNPLCKNLYNQKQKQNNAKKTQITGVNKEIMIKEGKSKENVTNVILHLVNICEKNKTTTKLALNLFPFVKLGLSKPKIKQCKKRKKNSNKWSRWRDNDQRRKSQRKIDNVKLLFINNCEKNKTIAKLALNKSTNFFSFSLLILS